MKTKSAKQKTSWEPVHKWYNKSVGDEGNYYHKHIIIPKILELLNLEKGKPAAILDLACGQGVLSRHLPNEVFYTGCDLSASLIKAAKQSTSNPNHHFIVGDVTKKLPVEKDAFTHATIILALQNISDVEKVLQNAYNALQENGKLIVVLNHPCFRIPRQSSWQIDAEKKIQYRRIDRYANPLEIPILTHPGQKNSPSTLSFHHPLTSYTKWLYEAGFLIQFMEEWCSNKVSTGSAAKMENRCRAEFPLFLTICAVKT